MTTIIKSQRKTSKGSTCKISRSFCRRKRKKQQYHRERNKNLSECINPLMPEMSGYVRTCKIEDKTNKLMSFCIDDEKLLS